MAGTPFPFGQAPRWFAACSVRQCSPRRGRGNCTCQLRLMSRRRKKLEPSRWPLLATRDATLLEGPRFHPTVSTLPYRRVGALSRVCLCKWGRGHDGAQSCLILDFPIRHVTQSASICWPGWKPGMTAMRDNRAAPQIAANDVDAVRREMCRTTPAGENRRRSLPDECRIKPRRS